MTETTRRLVTRLLSPDAPPFAVLHRPNVAADAVEILIGDLSRVDVVADLPGPPSPRLPVLAVVPFRQITERGFDVVDDGTPLLVLRATERIVVPLADLLPSLPDGSAGFRETGHDVPDEEYLRSVRSVLDGEIATGAGSNFVIHRCLTGQVDEPPARAALGALKRLLLAESSAYWRFAVHTPEVTLVGASPERHVSLDAGIVRMNPISGTLRYPAGGYPDAAAYRRAVLDFLADPKERDELAMVVDEELKMMAVVGDQGGRVRGPYLKRMSHLAHTEYLIEARTSYDVRDILTATMFAPTVTGSPIRNACRVIARHEGRGRRYYGGVLALIGRDDDGRQTLDAPILIRTAEIAAGGAVRIPAGATLVRGSVPESELAETRAKAAGILAALAPPTSPAPTSPVIMQEIATGSCNTVHDHGGVGDAGAGDEIASVLAGRNRTLASFWLQERARTVGPGRRGNTEGHRDGVSLLLGAGAGRRGDAEGHRDGVSLVSRPGAGRRVLVVDAEDDFTGMLAHLLGSLGLTTDVRAWDGVGELSPSRPDLVVLGPGPGDPRDLTDPRMLALHAIATARLASSRPLLGICLGHQVLSLALGLRVRRLARPDQGRQAGVDLFGTPRRVGFYNSFVAQPPGAPMPGLEFSLDAAESRVHAVRGPAVTGLQFHPESVLTTHGVDILVVELDRLLAGPGHTLRDTLRDTLTDTLRDAPGDTLAGTLGNLR
jgi:phenazine biosynthesis protein phzE